MAGDEEPVTAFELDDVGRLPRRAGQRDLADCAVHFQVVRRQPGDHDVAVRLVLVVAGDHVRRPVVVLEGREVAVIVGARACAAGSISWPR